MPILHTWKGGFKIVSKCQQLIEAKLIKLEHHALSDLEYNISFAG